jgi:sirohydrochlorin ferrochelatase
MKALILMSHGSRSDLANKEVIDLASSIGRILPRKCVFHAFLDVLHPTLKDAINQAVESGATDIDVLPLFLNSGNHVSKDIPQMIYEARSQYPKITLRLLRHIGAHPGYLSLVEDIAKNPEAYISI